MIQQAQQLDFDGKTMLYRWFVFVGATRFVTWAPNGEAAMRKTEARASLRRLNLKADRVEHAPSLLEEQS